MQKLPGTADLRAGSAASAGVARDVGTRRTNSVWDGVTDVMTEGAMLGSLARGRDERTRAAMGLAGELSPSAEARLNKIEELITKEAVRFRWTGQESVSVVIRPDAGTEVVVHLRQREGQVEAMLGMARGEAARFQGQWQQLHDALAEQNVRLVPGRESGQALNPAGAGTHLNLGLGSGSGSGPGGNPWPGGQSGAGTGNGTEWKDGFGGTADDRSADRRRSAELVAGEVERLGARSARTAKPVARRTGGVARPEGWEFWA